MRRAVLLARPDADRAPGGDTLQIRETAATLASAGWDARVVTDVRAGKALLRPGDVAHLWNAQRAGDWADLPEHARGLGAAVFLTPLLHPTGLYHRAGRRGLDGLAARVLTHPDRFAGLRFGRTDGVARAAEVLRAADRVLLAHDNEAALLKAWCGVAVGGTTVPPAIPVVEPEPVARPFDRDFLLCVGRIEPLKNPLAVVQAARSARRPVAFVGSVPRGKHLLYARRFRLSLGASVRWLGPRSPAQVAGLMKQSRVHVLASWTEVMGRVSVEAALAGSAVVATDVGHAPALLGRRTPGLYLARPGHQAALNAAIDAAWSAGRPTDGALVKRATALTWPVVGPALLDAYGAA